jgi:NADH-quinone oxidoreductase subunit L
MRKMGGLKKYLPITYWTTLIGSLALIGFPGFSGFFSKDAIVEIVNKSTIPGHGFAYFAVLAGIFITALYTFRLFFLVFHGEERMDAHTKEHLHEPPWVVTVPLIALAIPSVFIGGFTIGDVLFGDYFGGAVYIAEQHDALAEVGKHFHGAWAFVEHSFSGLPLYLMMAGVFTAWFVYMKRPDLATTCKKRFSFLYELLVNKYYFDDFNSAFFAAGSRKLGGRLWQVGDVTIVDGLLVNGSAKTVGWFAGIVRKLQTGYLYHYTFAMIIGVLMLLVMGLFL